MWFPANLAVTKGGVLECSSRQVNDYHFLS